MKSAKLASAAAKAEELAELQRARAKQDQALEERHQASLAAQIARDFALGEGPFSIPITAPPTNRTHIWVCMPAN